MKVHVEVDMTPEEARSMMGLPDVAPLQEKMMEEMQARMKAAFDTGDPEAMMQAWMPLGGAPNTAYCTEVVTAWPGRIAMGVQAPLSPTILTPWVGA